LGIILVLVAIGVNAAAYVVGQVTQPLRSVA
jgi:hypothetical protein